LRIVELGLPVTREEDGNLEAQTGERRRMRDDIREAAVLENGTHSDAAKAMCMNPSRRDVGVSAGYADCITELR